MNNWTLVCNSNYQHDEDRIRGVYAQLKEEVEREKKARLQAIEKELQEALEQAKYQRSRRLLLGPTEVAQHICLFLAAGNNTTLFTGQYPPVGPAPSATPIPLKRFHESLRTPLDIYLTKCYTCLSSVCGIEIVESSELNEFPTDLITTAISQLIADDQSVRLACIQLVYNFMVYTQRHLVDGREIMLSGIIWREIQRVPLSNHPNLPASFHPEPEPISTLAIPSTPMTIGSFSRAIKTLMNLRQEYLQKVQLRHPASKSNIENWVQGMFNNYQRQLTPDACKSLIIMIIKTAKLDQILVELLRGLNLGVHIVPM